MDAYFPGIQEQLNDGRILLKKLITNFDLQGFVKHAVLPVCFQTSKFEIVIEIELQELHLIVCKYGIASNPSSGPRKWIRKAFDTPFFSQVLADALRKNQAITRLDLTRSKIGDDDLKAWW